VGICCHRALKSSTICMIVWIARRKVVVAVGVVVVVVVVVWM
jgi:hypothetical protein